MMPRLRSILLLLVLIGWPLTVASAQGGTDTGVWITTQDFCSFRTGPGMSFERTAVIDPGITLPAIGRSANTQWIQVEYQGQRGWLYAGWLVWVGDLASLPVDGVDPNPFVRRMMAAGITTRETPIYRRDIAPADQVGVLPEGTEVEITGHLGLSSDGFYRLQILYEGQLYWVGAWNIRVTDGSVQRVLDTAYLFAYGRLGSRLSADISRTTNTLYNVESIWLSLQAGETVYCTNIPPYASRKASDTDVSQEPVFAPLIAALDNGINSTNAAISRFSDACSRTDVFLTDQDVIAALAEIELARQNLNVASSLLVSLKVRDPLVGR
ncbi:MAG: SH3 domain-containing protein [Chloroflexi bacterium]|nr:SH3 domain-containing protein [Chloroflexota bacterium]